jgi:hypothetical protein
MTRDPNGVRQPPVMQRAPESGDVAELGIGERGCDLQARGSRVESR